MASLTSHHAPYHTKNWAAAHLNSIDHAIATNTGRLALTPEAFPALAGGSEAPSAIHNDAPWLLVAVCWNRVALTRHRSHGKQFSREDTRATA